MQKKQMKKGFTLIELMVVLIILGLIATFVGPKILSMPDKARVDKTKIDMKAIETALKMYKLDTGVYPTTEQGLRALVIEPDIDPVPRGWRPGGYLDLTDTPQDPWDNDYIYRSPGEIDGRDYEIISLGADKKEGGEDYNADIRSYEQK